MTTDAIDRRLEALEENMHEVLSILRGDGVAMGLIAKLQIVWSSYVWILCTISAAAGSLVTWLVTR